MAFDPYQVADAPWQEPLETQSSIRRYVSGGRPQRPARKSKRELMRLSALERARYDHERILWHATERFFPMPILSAVEEAIDKRLRFNSAAGTTRRPIALDAEGDQGKTASLRHYIYRSGRRHAEHGVEPPRALGEGALWIPDAYIKLPTNANAKDVGRKLHAFLENPFNDSDKAQVLVEKATQALKASGTRLLILDDAHRLLELRRGTLDEAMNTLKNLADVFTLVLAGVGLEKKGLFDDSQIGGRCLHLKVEPSAYKTDDDEHAWNVLLRYFDEDLVLARQPKEWLWSPEVADLLYERTGGYIGSLKELIANAAQDAIEDGTERLTLASLKTTRLNHNADERRPQSKVIVAKRQAAREIAA